MKNFFGVQSLIRKDIKPSFRYQSAPLGVAVEAEVQYRDGVSSGCKRGYYLFMTVKTFNPDGTVIWMPMTAPRVRVLLGEAKRFNFSTLQGFAYQLDNSIPVLVAAWERDGAAADVSGRVTAMFTGTPATVTL